MIILFIIINLFMIIINNTFVFYVIFCIFFHLFFSALFGDCFFSPFICFYVHIYFLVSIVIILFYIFLVYFIYLAYDRFSHSHHYFIIIYFYGCDLFHFIITINILPPENFFSLSICTYIRFKESRVRFFRS